MKKNISRIIFYRIFTLFLIVSSFSLFSCQDETYIKAIGSSHPNPDIQNMLTELSALPIYKKANGVLFFVNPETLQRTLNILQFYCDKAMDNDTSITYCDVLGAFEDLFKFQSLRNAIENEISSLENNNNLFEYNDPDNHFIVDEFLRAVLTPNCEIIVGDLLYVYLDGFVIGIMNNDSKTRQDLLKLISSNCTEDELFFFCNDNKNAFISSDEKPTLTTNFSFDTISTPLNYYFSNTSSCEEYNQVSYLWDFGDGTTSSMDNPTHAYSSAGEKTVTLHATYDGTTQTIIKKINVGYTSVDFSFTYNGWGKYYFTASANTDNDPILYYHWDFGDGHDTLVYNTNNNSKKITHEYSLFNTTYTVTLTIKTVGNLQYSCRQNISVPQKKDCKTQATAHTGPNNNLPHYHLIDNQYIKTSIGIYNSAVMHILSTKTVFLKKKNNNSYSRIKAKSISTGPRGAIYFPKKSGSNGSCGAEIVFSLTKSNSNKKKICWSRAYWGLDEQIAVDYHSIGTYFEVKNDNDYVQNGIGITLHNHQ